MKLPIVYVTAFVLVVSCVAFSQDKTSTVGTWKQDAAQSNTGSNPAPKSVTLRILKDTPEMLSWRVSGLDDKGKPFSYSWHGPQDGSMHPVLENGKAGKSMQSAKKEQDGSLLRHGEDPDGSSFDAHSRLSEDGKTITDEITVKSKDGKETKEKDVYHRASGTSKKSGAKPPA